MVEQYFATIRIDELLQFRKGSNVCFLNSETPWISLIYVNDDDLIIWCRLMFLRSSATGSISC